MMKSYDPYPMMMHFREHQGIHKGETISELIGGKTVKFKVNEIRSIRTLPDGVQEVIMMVRELPDGDQDAK